MSPTALQITGAAHLVVAARRRRCAGCAAGEPPSTVLTSGRRALASLCGLDAPLRGRPASACASEATALVLEQARAAPRGLQRGGGIVGEHVAAAGPAGVALCAARTRLAAPGSSGSTATARRLSRVSAAQELAKDEPVSGSGSSRAGIGSGSVSGTQYECTVRVWASLDLILFLYTSADA